jgi:hypothetical protein
MSDHVYELPELRRRRRHERGILPPARDLRFLTLAEAIEHAAYFAKVNQSLCSIEIVRVSEGWYRLEVHLT